jgi:hypothetical protein
LASLGREPTPASDMVACFKCNLVFKTYFRKVYREIKIERPEEQCDNCANKSYNAADAERIAKGKAELGDKWVDHGLSVLQRGANEKVFKRPISLTSVKPVSLSISASVNSTSSMDMSLSTIVKAVSKASFAMGDSEEGAYGQKFIEEQSACFTGRYYQLWQSFYFIFLSFPEVTSNTKQFETDNVEGGERRSERTKKRADQASKELQKLMADNTSRSDADRQVVWRKLEKSLTKIDGLVLE